MPPNWSIYLAVANLDASLEKLQSLGGQAISPAMAVEGVGRFAFICDPQGAYCTIIEPASSRRVGRRTETRFKE